LESPLGRRFRISFPKGTSVREAEVERRSKPPRGNTRREHHTPQAPACMAGTGRD